MVARATLAGMTEDVWDCVIHAFASTGMNS
jgi:hypothetical protein